MTRLLQGAMAAAPLLGLLLITPCMRLPAQVLEQEGAQVADLKDQLEKGLRARRPIEFQFLGRVVQLVKTEQLPQPLVQGTYAWTVKKYRTKKYLVPYFEQVLRLRAKQEKLTVLNNVPTTLTFVQ